MIDYNYKRQQFDSLLLNYLNSSHNHLFDARLKRRPGFSVCQKKKSGVIRKYDNSWPTRWQHLQRHRCNLANHASDETKEI